MLTSTGLVEMISEQDTDAGAQILPKGHSFILISHYPRKILRLVRVYFSALTVVMALHITHRLKDK